MYTQIFLCRCIHVYVFVNAYKKTTQGTHRSVVKSRGKGEHKGQEELLKRESHFLFIIYTYYNENESLLYF